MSEDDNNFDDNFDEEFDEDEEEEDEFGDRRWGRQVVFDSKISTSLSSYALNLMTPCFTYLIFYFDESLSTSI